MYSNAPPALTSAQIAGMSQDESMHKVLELLVSRERYGVIALQASMLITMAVMIVLIEVRPLARLIQKMSHSVFYWGDMVQIHDHFQKLVSKVRWGIVIAFIVSLIASLVGGVILSK